MIHINAQWESIWWPDDVSGPIERVEGSGEHGHRDINPSNEHVFVFKQTRERVIWACACGETLSRRKP